MKAGDIVIYSPAGALGHVMGGSPGKIADIVQDVARTWFEGRLEPVALADLTLGRIYWRKATQGWQGPYDSPADAMADMLQVCGHSTEGIERAFQRLADCPRGLEIISAGWRYRLAWGGDSAPERYG